MNNILTERLISLRELALMAFAVFLLAAAPGEEINSDAVQQPVNVTIPAEQAEEVQVNEA